MKILSLFSGIGAFEKALERLNINYELVGFSEIDKYAIKSYCAIHNVDENKNLSDITKIDIFKLPKDIDLITHGSPCQDFSLAGKQAGGDLGTGTRSSLMWNTVNIVTYCKPKYVIWENVKNLLSKKHRHNFDNYLSIMESLGYNNYYQVLNAKDYGIPQNRERVYTISIRKDIDKKDFVFPDKEILELRLKDILENEVNEKYYLKDYQIQNILKSNFNTNKRRIQEKEYCDTLCARDWKDPKCIRMGGIFDTEKSKHQAGSIYDKEGLSPTLNTMEGGWRQPMIINKTICLNSKDGRNGIEGIQPSLKNRIYDSNAIATCITTSNFFMPNYTDNLKIRKLTPKECWRLMGFDDEDFEKAINVPTSNTQLYKQARKFDCSKCIRKNI